MTTDWGLCAEPERRAVPGCGLGKVRLLMELQKFTVQSSLSSLVLGIFGAKYSWKGLPCAL